MKDNNILAAVLAGGKSERFGLDKSQVKLGNKTLIEHILNKIEPFFENKLIVTKNSLENINSFNAVVINDCIEGHLGPLVGVLSTMKWAEKNLPQINWIITFPCDTPFFNNGIINEFKKKTNSNESLLYFATSKKRRHNIFGLWSLKLLKTLETDIIKNNFRKVEDWANKIGVKTIDVSYNEIDPFFNINTREDLLKAEQILKIYKND